MTWRYALLLAGLIISIASGFAVKSGMAANLREAALGIAAVLGVGGAVVALVLFISRVAATKIHESNVALRALAAETHLVYQDLAGSAIAGRPACGQLVGNYRGAQVHVSLASHHGDTLNTAIVILDFPVREHEPWLRGVVGDVAEIDLSGPNRSQLSVPSLHYSAELADLVSQLASNGMALVFSDHEFKIFIKPIRSSIDWLSASLSEFDIENDPVRLKAILDCAVSFYDSCKRAP